MRIWLFVSFAMVLSSFCSMAIADETPDLLRRCGETQLDLCGFIDAKAWREDRREVFILDPIYEDARDFSEGLAAVRIDGLFGYIDTSGEIVIRPQFVEAGAFSHGLALVGDQDGLGIINRQADLLVNYIFAEAYILNEDIIIANSVKDAEWVRIPQNIHLENAGLYHLEDGWVTEQKFGFSHFDKERVNLVWAQAPSPKPTERDGLYGLMRMDGSWLVKPKYEYASELKNNRAPVRKRFGTKTKSGAIDETGRVVIPFEYDLLSHLSESEGFLLASQGRYPNQKYGIVNASGKLLSGRYFDEIQGNSFFGPDHPKQDFFSVKDGGVWKSLLKDGSLISDKRSGQLFLECDQFSIFYTDAGYALKPKDQTLPTITFEDTLFSSSDQICDPPPTLVKGGTYATVLDNGSIFGGFFENSNGFFGPNRWVEVNDKWGLVDANGEFQLDPIYDSIEIETLFNQLFSHRSNRPVAETKETYRVSTGETVYRLSFSNGEYKREPYTKPEVDHAQVLNCSGGLKRKSKNDLWGIVDEMGKFIIQPEYRAISCFGSGVAWVPDDTQRQWCAIDFEGLPRLAPACKDFHISGYISHHSPEKFDDDPYESNVLWERALLDYGEGRRDQEPKFVPWDF